MTKYQKNKRISSNKTTIRFVLGLCLAFILVTLIISFAPPAKAQFFGSNDEEKNDLTQKARDREYVGGGDEDELRVLPQLPSAKDKKAPADNSEGF